MMEGEDAKNLGYNRQSVDDAADDGSANRTRTTRS